MPRADVIIVGAGHNGLVTATLLARAGLSVRVLEAASRIGGACRTEYPFPSAPRVGQSTGAYLLGLMPPELMQMLGISLPLIARDPHSFLPTTGQAYLLAGSDDEQTRAQIASHFSVADARAHQSLHQELAQLRQDLAPSWLEPASAIEEVAMRHVRPALRGAFVGLCRGSVTDYLGRFGFESELLESMYAVTDGLTGLDGDADTPGSGMNFLAHNMCRLPGSKGTWMVVRGGMGTVTHALADSATRAGATITCDTGVTEIEVRGGTATGVVTDSGLRLSADIIVSNADPLRTTRLLGDACPEDLARWVDTRTRTGTSMKVNLCLRGLPRFSCLPNDLGQHRATIHLLPERNCKERLRGAYRDCQEGRLPADPSIEWYVHTTLDPSLSDEHGHHSSALFVQWVPHTLAESSWSQEESRFTRSLLEICDRFAPGTSDLVVDSFVLTPPKIESHFGITGGHIHHLDNRFGFDQRFPTRLPVEGLYACGAGSHPAGSVIGAAGHNAAQAVLADLPRVS